MATNSLAIPSTDGVTSNTSSLQVTNRSHSTTLSSTNNSLPSVGITRRHSIYGTGEDRIVLDIGSLYIKAGFSGESRPRHIVPVYAGNMKTHWDQDFNGSGGVIKACGEGCRIVGEFAELFDLEIEKHPDGIDTLYDRLAHYLREIYFRYLLTDPKQRKVVLCESPMMPLKLKQLITKVLFENLQVPSISFAPSHMLALLTTGCTTGLVIDVGHLETTVLPTFSARPLTPFIKTTPLAGRALTKRLKDLLSTYGSMIIPPSTSLVPVHGKYLTHAVLEDIKTRFIFVSPIMVSASSIGIAEKTDVEDMERKYASVSSSTEILYPITISKNGRERQIGTLVVPGWIRERCAEVLFEGDEDESSVVGCALECLLKTPIYLRKELASSILLIGGTALLPNFQSRFAQEILRALHTDKRFSSLSGLVDHIDFLEDNGSGKVFVSNCRAWL
ncbi:15120_t:CDS:2 [Entrophospora sp. SA101]|nr:4665_t:CDS:2 [Entrophospora sp. SA101]CAJ0756896.1 15120_t:CDS:2 [Entrophospora sp. SA101]CAJ0826871.1 7158_t:CDS:2 [Entrophospora sp. SA101]CAJ0888688.1 2085_t:CDS:2 [Entrophospora sp. SA101]